ncbi:MAG: hypothetical protein WCE94_15225 [Candidatus Methanoperedens sp.]
MTETTLTVQDAAETGITPSFGAASATGSKFINDGRVILEVKNTSGSPINVTVVGEKACRFGAVDSRVVAVPATTGDKIIGPFKVAHFNDASGYAHVTFSAQSNVTVAAIRIPQA